MEKSNLTLDKVEVDQWQNSYILRDLDSGVELISSGGILAYWIDETDTDFFDKVDS